MTTEQPLNTTSPRGSTPVPDPTELTDKAIAKLKEQLEQFIEGKVDVLEERLSGIDEATKLRLQSVTDIPDQIERSVNGLEKLMNEKFDAAERLRVEQKKDTKDAVDAALNAAKEAVKEQTASSEKSITKSELATGAQIKQLQDTFTTAIDGLRRANDDLKDREIDDVRTLRQSITDVATTANGTVSQKVGAKEDRTALYAAMGIIVTILLAAITIAGVLAARPV
jgi:hypothetical protein